MKVYYMKSTPLGLRHQQLRPMQPPPLNPTHEAAGAELPIQGVNSYAPLKTLLKCPCLRQRQLLPSLAVQHSFSWTMVLQGAPRMPSTGPGTPRYTRSIC